MENINDNQKLLVFIIIRFPGKIKPESRIESPVSQTDLFATILDYLQIQMHPSDGKSLRRLIEGTVDKNTFVVTEWLSDLKTKPSHMVLKSGWKLLLPDSSATGDLKALYNLNEDPFEMKNLLGKNPDSSGYNSRVEELESCFREWKRRTSAKKLQN